MIERLSHPASVDIWRVDLEDDWDRFATVLSADEHARALRYSVEPPAQQFRRCRIALRLLLARYLHCAPGEVIFRYPPTGKPELARSAKAPPLHFNVSHCRRRALVAVAAGPVGIDLEFVHRDGEAVSELIDLVCHPDEKRALGRLPVDQRAPCFYRLWTRKEAYCKARGTGLQLSLPAIRFLLRQPGHPAVVEYASAASPWWTYDLDDAEEHVATLCYPNPRARIRSAAATAGSFHREGCSAADDAIANGSLYRSVPHVPCR